MRKIQVCLLLFVSFLVPLGAQAQDAESILAKARELQLARWDGVDNYSVQRSTAGTTITIDYIRVDETSFRVVPRVGMAGMGQGGDGSVVNFDEMQDIAKTARYLGKETIGGRESFHLKAEDVEHVEESADQTLEFDTFEIWLDTKEYVPLKMLIHGTATSPEGTREIGLDGGLLGVDAEAQFPEQTYELAAGDRLLGVIDREVAKPVRDDVVDARRGDHRAQADAPRVVDDRGARALRAPKQRPHSLRRHAEQAHQFGRARRARGFETAPPSSVR